MSLLGLTTSRLYSKFPAGSVGLALLALRLVDGIGLMGAGIQLTTPLRTSSEPIGALLLGVVLIGSAVLLILGLRTPWAGGAAAVGTMASALYASHSLNFPEGNMNAWFFLFALVFSLSSSLALLGPGGYSLDARLSGWRVIRLSSRPSNSNKQEEGGYVDR